MFINHIIQIIGIQSEIDIGFEVLRAKARQLETCNDMEIGIDNAYWLPKDCNYMTTVEIFFTCAKLTLLEMMPGVAEYFPSLHFKLTFLDYDNNMSGCSEYYGGHLIKQKIDLYGCDSVLFDFDQHEKRRIQEYIERHEQRCHETAKAYFKDIRNKIKANNMESTWTKLSQYDS